MEIDYETVVVSRDDGERLVRWMLEALERAGCRVLHSSEPDRAPFRITFETPLGSRIGVLAYAFLARRSRGRSWSLYGSKTGHGSGDGRLHDLWQDPFGLYITLLLGIDLEQGFFVGADPVLRSPTPLPVPVEFGDEHVHKVLNEGWAFWERAAQRGGFDEPVEVLVGGRQENFLQYVRFEQIARGLDTGHRQLVAEQMPRRPGHRQLG